MTEVRYDECCYACMVGVSTGPESHDEHCPLRHSPRDTPKKHRIYTSPPSKGRCWWECSCGHSGSADERRVGIHSDRHITQGERRVDTNRPL